MGKIFIIILVFLLTLSCVKVENKAPYEDQLKVVKACVEKNNYNSNYCILVDFNRHSGLKRMFIYDLNRGLLEDAFLVAHGSGSGTYAGKPQKFSNIEGSNASSVGLSVLGDRAYSNYGIHIKYWLKGLDKTNDNMQKRVVVLHSWSGIPDEETYPKPIINSLGCFTVADNTLKKIDKLVKEQSNKKVVLYAFKG